MLGGGGEDFRRIGLQDKPVPFGVGQVSEDGCENAADVDESVSGAIRVDVLCGGRDCLRERRVADDLEVLDEGNVVVTGVLTVNGVVGGSGNPSAQTHPVAASVGRRIGAAVPEAHAAGLFFVDDGESTRIVVAKEHDLSGDVDSGCFRTFDCKSGAWAGNAKADLKRHVFTIENGLQTIDGENYTTAAVRGTNPGSDQVLYLFARLLTWSPLCQNHCFMRLYSSQIYSNGELVRDFVPARVLGFTCLYDRVNNRPYLPHGGDFILPQQGTTIIIR